jgi:hypothetical protein
MNLFFCIELPPSPVGGTPATIGTVSELAAFSLDNHNQGRRK